MSVTKTAEEWELAKQSALQLAQCVEVAYSFLRIRRDWVVKEAGLLLEQLSDKRKQCQQRWARLPRDIWPGDDATRSQHSEERGACEPLCSLSRRIEKELARKMTGAFDQSPRFEPPRGSQPGWLQFIVLAEFVNPRSPRKRQRQQKSHAPKRRNNFARNKWIHEQISRGRSLRSIAETICQEHPGWSPLHSPQAIQRAHQAYLRHLRKDTSLLASKETTDPPERSPASPCPRVRSSGRTLVRMTQSMTSFAQIN